MDADKKVAVFLTVIGSHLYKLLWNLQLVSPSKPTDKSVKATFGAQAKYI